MWGPFDSYNIKRPNFYYNYIIRRLAVPLRACTDDVRNHLMDKTFGLSAGRSGVRIPGRGKYSLRTIAVDAIVKYPLYFMFILDSPRGHEFW